MKNYFFLIGLLFLTLFSCEEKPVEPSCTDGFLNNSETDVDCGGPNCADCVDNTVHPLFFASFKDSTTQYETMSATLIADTFFVEASMSNSTINFGVYNTANFNGTSDTSIMVPNSYRITLGSFSYDQPLFNAGGPITGIAMQVDAERELIEGYFYFATELESGIDTISVENGQFIEIPYE